MQNKKNKQYGFSLIELSIVLIVISLLMIFILKGSQLISSVSLENARKKTVNSPVVSMKGLIFWYESTLPNSFLTSEVFEGSAISTWFDNSGTSLLNSNNLTQSTSANRPTYLSKAINGLPALRFNGTSNFLVANNISFPNNDYEIFLVLVANNTSSQMNLVEMTTTSLHGMIFAATPNAIIRILHRFPYGISGNQDDNYSSSNAFVAGQPYIFGYSRGGESNVASVFLNGSVAINAAVTRPSFDSSLLTLNLGSLLGTQRFFNGYMSEIIIFDRSLSDQERKDIELYLSDKYNIAISS